MPLVVPTSSSPTLSDFIARLRLDLFDAGQRAGDQPRWSDADLARALDRANDRYSSVSPRVRESQLPTVAGSRLYASPEDSWWIQAAEYPIGFWPKWYRPVQERLSPYIDQPPADSGSATLTPGGALSAGEYTWYVSFRIPGGSETMSVPLTGGTAAAGSKAILFGIPIGPYGVDARVIYRTGHDGTTAYLTGVIADNLTTSFEDSQSDAGIALNDTPATANTTQDHPQFELQIPDGSVPPPGDAGGIDPHYGWIGLRYAVKHELDANGTSIPERHWDALTLGGTLAAINAYLVPTADNFRFVDGQLRDQVDDTKAPTNWLLVAQDMERRFETRLAEIRNEAICGVSATASWGDKPLRWDRL